MEHRELEFIVPQFIVQSPIWKLKESHWAANKAFTCILKATMNGTFLKLDSYIPVRGITTC